MLVSETIGQSNSTNNEYLHMQIEKTNKARTVYIYYK